MKKIIVAANLDDGEKAIGKFFLCLELDDIKKIEKKGERRGSLS